MLGRECRQEPERPQGPPVNESDRSLYRPGRGAEGSMSRNRIRNLIAGQGLPFETLCIESCLTAVVVVTGGLAVGRGVFERDPGDLERLHECRCRVAEYPVGVSAARSLSK